MEGNSERRPETGGRRTGVTGSCRTFYGNGVVGHGHECEMARTSIIDCIGVVGLGTDGIMMVGRVQREGRIVPIAQASQAGQLYGKQENERR